MLMLASVLMFGSPQYIKEYCEDSVRVAPKFCKPHGCCVDKCPCVKKCLCDCACKRKKK